MLPRPLTPPQEELYNWIVGFLRDHGHAPSIRQMMEAMGLRSPAPVQSRLQHLRKKGWILWQQGQARTLQLTRTLDAAQGGIPVLGAVAAGGLIEAFDDNAHDSLDLNTALKGKNLFALTVNGDSMVDAHIADGDTVVMEPVFDARRIRQGTIVSAFVAGAGTTLKHFHLKGSSVRLEAANENYEPIVVPADQVIIQGRLVAVWRTV